MIVDGVKVTKDFACDESELKEYVAFARARLRGELIAIDLHLNGDYVDINYTMKEPFERIRRITGYLVGTMNRWNDSKRAEEKDRVKHETRNSNGALAI